MLSIVLFLLHKKNYIAQGKTECNIIFLHGIKMILYETKCNINFIICLKTKSTNSFEKLCPFVNAVFAIRY